MNIYYVPHAVPGSGDTRVNRMSPCSHEVIVLIRQKTVNNGIYVCVCTHLYAYILFINMDISIYNCI